MQIFDKDIRPVDSLDKLESMTSVCTPALVDQTVILKLNGGLATSMKLQSPKTMLNVKGSKCFLDFMALQVRHLRKVCGPNLHFMLLNSFKTVASTKAFLKKYPELYNSFDSDVNLMQNRVPKILQSTLAPAEWPTDRECEWCPPGHGDLFTTLYASGKLHELLRRGYKYMFVSNGDNLGATLDMHLLAHMQNNNVKFLMEVCRRTESDRKGGHLAQRTIAAEEESNTLFSSSDDDDDDNSSMSPSRNKFLSLTKSHTGEVRLSHSTRAGHGGDTNTANMSASSSGGGGGGNDSRACGDVIDSPLKTNGQEKANSATRTQLLIRELAQCPESESASFQNILRYNHFNTNNIWINLPALASIMEHVQGDAGVGVLPLPIICNAKTVNPIDDSSPPVFQIETAMGSAIELFKDSAAAVVVPRTRFAPVKNFSDLLCLRSDAYVVTPEWCLVLDERCAHKPPTVKLDPKYYANETQFEKLLQHGVPSLVHCTKLIIRGPMIFGAQTVLKGEVVLENTDTSKWIKLDDGAVFQNCQIKL